MKALLAGIAILLATVSAHSAENYTLACLSGLYDQTRIELIFKPNEKVLFLHDYNKKLTTKVWIKDAQKVLKQEGYKFEFKDGGAKLNGKQCEKEND